MSGCFDLKREPGRSKDLAAGEQFRQGLLCFDALYVKTREQGLMRMEGDQLSNVPGGAPFSKIGITDAITLDGSALIASPVGKLWTFPAASILYNPAGDAIERNHPA